MFSSRTAAVIIFTLWTTAAGGQRRLFTSYTMNEGLVNNAIQRVYQDTRGFIWVATWEGVSKYDGNKFINYTKASGLAHDFVNDFFETAPDNLYAACNDGSFALFKNGTITITADHPVINTFRVLYGNRVIVTTDHNGLWEFNKGRLNKPAQPRPGSNYYRLAPFNDSLFVATCDSTVQVLNSRYEIITEWRQNGAFATESGLLTDSKGRTWLGTRHGLKLLSPVQQKDKPLAFSALPVAFNIPELNDQWIKAILEDANGNTWIGTQKGLIKIGSDGSRQVITIKDGLPANDVICLYQDREQNIWVGGSGGLSKLVTKVNVQVYTTESGLLSDNMAYLVPFKNGNILAASDKGLQLFSRSNRFTNIVSGNYHTDDDCNSSLSVQVDKKRKINFLTYFNNPSEPLFFGPSSIAANCAAKDENGGYFSSSNGHGTYFTRDFITWKEILYRTPARTLLVDSKGNLWVGAWDSSLLRIRYQYSNDTPHVLESSRFLPSAGIRSLYEDSKGYIWAGTRYNGVYRLNPNDAVNAEMLHFDQSSGLTSNRIVSIGESKNGCIWLNNYSGLDKLVPIANNKYRVLNFSRIANFFTNINMMAFDASHTLWLATTQGLMRISDADFEDMKPLQVYITSALLGDSSCQAGNEKKIKVGYHYRTAHFDFSAPGFINQQQVMYSYRLLGSNNEEWSLPTNEHSVSYASLHPGTYRFEVRTQGWNSQWGKPAVFEFQVQPPFWQTWWFISGLSLLAIAMLVLLVRRRIKSIRHEADLKQKISETEMMALRAQMNPHFIFNCLNAIDNLIQTSQKEKATIYLGRFARLIRNVLDNSKNSVVPFQKDFESLQLYLQMEQFRNDNKFSYTLTADEELLHGDYRVPPQLVQPFVENAILHGLLNKQDGEKKLSVHAAVDNEFIKYTVTDNGVGRARSRELNALNKPNHQSYGIEITKQRILLYNKSRDKKDVTITDLWEDENPAGTKAVIQLKIYDSQ